jgi:hypothetical protein
VPRFYFDVREGFDLEPDETGLDLKNIDAAETTAMHVAGEFGSDRLPASKGGAITVEVRYKQKQMVVSVRITMGSERFVPETLH